jgi:K+-transporting ATPase KdpF subunit
MTETVIYAIGGLTALGLFVYLVFALLKPEWFS